MSSSCTYTTVLVWYKRPILKLFMFNSDAGRVTSDTADVTEALFLLTAATEYVFMNIISSSQMAKQRNHSSPV